MKKMDIGRPEGGGLKDRRRPSGKAIAIAAGCLAAVLLAACLASTSKSKSERQVKLRYDGQTYAGQSVPYESSRRDHAVGWDAFGGTSKSEMSDVMGVAPDMDAGGAMNGAAMDDGFSVSGEMEGGASDGYDSGVGQHGKKLAYYYDYTAETTDFDGFSSSLASYVAGKGGYVESTYLDSREYDMIGKSERRAVRMGQWDIRLPADDAKAFQAFFDGTESSVTGSDVRMADRTAAYADAELQAESYRAEYARLEALIPQAESVTELIEIQDRLSSLNYQIQWQEKQKDLIDEDVEMSSISLTAYEVIYYSTTVESYRFRFGEEMADAFEDFLFAAPMFLFAMVYLSLGGFVVIGLSSVLFRVMFSIRNKKSRDQVVRIVDGRDGKDGTSGA